jgi:polyhydroxyalkanoate synthase subunit PhaC
MPQDSPSPPGPDSPLQTHPSRLGPRPLSAHLSMAQQAWMSCAPGWMQWKSGSPSWSQNPALSAAAQALDAHPESAVQTSLEREGRARMARLLHGIDRYRHHPYRRALPDPAVLWSDGTTRVLDYGVGGAGRPLLVVPSLVNRWYVLDLTPETSLLRWLADQGWRPLCVDWGRPGPLERGWGLDDYIGVRLRQILQLIAQDGPVPIMGYCMGGTMAAALATLAPESVAALVLLAAPWDFHASEPATAKRMAGHHAAMASALAAWGEMPTELLQSFFFALDPMLAARKFAAFTPAMAASVRGQAFVALEDWLNDGVPLAAPVAEQALVGWYGDNQPGTGRWQVDGHTITPQALRMPALAVIPSGDRIVPPANAAALAERLPHCTRMQPLLGHVGMVVGARAQSRVWEPLQRWLADNTQI